MRVSKIEFVSNAHFLNYLISNKAVYGDGYRYELTEENIPIRIYNNGANEIISDLCEIRDILADEILSCIPIVNDRQICIGFDNSCDKRILGVFIEEEGFLAISEDETRVCDNIIPVDPILVLDQAGFFDKIIKEYTAKDLKEQKKPF